MQTLTPAQRRAVRWYIGDVDGADPFWGDVKAYVTVNALFFDGITAETARAAEGKRLNPAILADPDRLQSVLRDLLSAFSPLETPLETYRVERFSDFERLRQAGGTISFTSTSTAGFLDAYRDRIGIALMRFSLPAGTPCIPMAQMLADYAKADEAEVLLPPGMRLHLTQLPLRPEEARILDADGAPPVISVKAVPDGSLPRETVSSEVPDASRIAGMEVLSALNAGAVPASDAAAQFTLWKRAIVSRLPLAFSD